MDLKANEVSTSQRKCLKNTCNLLQIEEHLSIKDVMKKEFSVSSIKSGGCYGQLWTKINFLWQRFSFHSQIPNSIKIRWIGLDTKRTSSCVLSTQFLQNITAISFFVYLYKYGAQCAGMCFFEERYLKMESFKTTQINFADELNAVRQQQSRLSGSLWQLQGRMEMGMFRSVEAFLLFWLRSLAWNQEANHSGNLHSRLKYLTERVRELGRTLTRFLTKCMSCISYCRKTVQNGLITMNDCWKKKEPTSMIRHGSIPQCT
jgi:hypothetical protein